MQDTAHLLTDAFAVGALRLVQGDHYNAAVGSAITVSEGAPVSKLKPLTLLQLCWQELRTYCLRVPDVNSSVMKLTVRFFWSSHES